MMKIVKQGYVRNLTCPKHWLSMGLLLSLAIIGLGGCGSQKTTSAPTEAATQSSTTTPDASASANQSTTSSQENQGQTQKPTLNPAVEAAMGIRRLQSNQQMALSSDQKDKIKPILQLLIDTSNPSQDFLQEKADAINALFTDQQKTYLSTNAPKVPEGNPNGNQTGNGQKGQEPPKDQTKGQNGAPEGKKGAPSAQSQDIFKQVLASLT